MPRAESRILRRYRSVRRAGALALSLLVAACGTTIPASETTSTAASRPTPADTATPVPAVEPTADTRATDPPRKQSVKPSGVTVIDPDRSNEDAQRHRLVLRQRSDIALPPADVGYYLDNLQARFIQKLRNSTVVFARAGNVIGVRIVGARTFATNSSSLTDEMKSALTPLAEVLAEYDKTRVQIGGHTDDSGPEDYNQKLSEQRAFALAGLLVEAGVDPKRIAVIGFGESKPLQANNSEAARAKNRRLELRIEPVIALTD